MSYVDGYLLPVKKDRLNEYIKLAEDAGKVWIKHGALEYRECVGDDLSSVKEWGGAEFERIANVQEDETVIFAFISYKSKDHRDEVNTKVHQEMEKDQERYKDRPMPFDMNRMAFGGFRSVVELS